MVSVDAALLRLRRFARPSAQPRDIGVMKLQIELRRHPLRDIDVIGRRFRPFGRSRVRGPQTRLRA